jgi:hypothetical protein
MRFFAALASAVLVSALLASTSVAAEPGSSGQALRERVTAYWQARTRADLRGAYPFYEPAFRARYTSEAFARNFGRLNRFAPEFLGIVAVAIDARGTRARVKVKLRTTPAVLDGHELISVTEEVWLLQKGTWWKQEESLVPNV